MNKKNLILLTVILSATIAACGTPMSPDAEEPVTETDTTIVSNGTTASLTDVSTLSNRQTTSVVGTLREVGSAQYSSVVVTTKTADIRLNLKKEQIVDYPRLQGRTISVYGTVKVQEVSYGSITRNYYSIEVKSASIVK